MAAAIVVTNQAELLADSLPKIDSHIHETLNQEMTATDARSMRFITVRIILRSGSHPIELSAIVESQAGTDTARAKEFDIDLAESWMVGDRYGDIELAATPGSTCIRHERLRPGGMGTSASRLVHQPT